MLEESGINEFEVTRDVAVMLAGFFGMFEENARLRVMQTPEGLWLMSRNQQVFIGKDGGPKVMGSRPA